MFKRYVPGSNRFYRLLNCSSAHQFSAEMPAIMTLQNNLQERQYA